tara:strand:+ start:201 stop:416 length:216 start_codon:yes stop_codon:yes gene_type:complete
MTVRQKIRRKLELGQYEEINDVCICCIERQIPKEHVYQVHSDNYKYKFSKLYYNIDKAIGKFLEIKYKLRK